MSNTLPVVVPQDNNLATLAAAEPQPDLKALAATIRDAHQGATGAGITIVRATDLMLQHALVAGNALLAAKHAVRQARGHGHWLPWLKEECDLSEREAQRYMFIARHRATLEANTTCVSDLTVTGALQLLKKLLNPTADRPRSNRSGPRAKTSDTPQKLTRFDIQQWLCAAPIEECRRVFDAVGGKRMRQMIPPTWGVSLVAVGESIDEIDHLHARIVALETEIRERDRALLGADPGDGLDIPSFLRRARGALVATEPSDTAAFSGEQIASGALAATEARDIALLPPRSSPKARSPRQRRGTLPRLPASREAA